MVPPSKKLTNKAIISLMRLSKTPDAMKDLLTICSDESILGIISVIANIIHNPKITKKIPTLKLRKLKKSMQHKQNEWINITSTKSGDVNKKRKFLQKQSGSGIITLIGVLASTLIPLISKFVH